MPLKTQARNVCYQEIQTVVKMGMQTYYREHPDLLFDARSEAAITSSSAGLTEIFKVLDKYDISYRKPEP